MGDVTALSYHVMSNIDMWSFGASAWPIAIGVKEKKVKIIVLPNKPLVPLNVFSMLHVGKYCMTT